MGQGELFSLDGGYCTVLYTKPSARSKGSRDTTYETMDGPDQDPNNPFADVNLEEGDFGDLEGDMGGDEVFTDQDTLLSGKVNVNAASSSNGGDGGTSGGAKPGGMCSCFTVQYYQPYFDVDTAVVRARMMRSLTAIQPANRDFLSITQNNADLYGPFWIITTLVFVIGATSNFSSYLGFVQSADNPRWYYDFTLMTGAAGLCYGFGFGVPAGMWAMAKYFNLPLSLIQAVCLYGYSHSVYVMVAILCMVPSDLVGWFSIGLAAFLSCTFVGLNLRESSTVSLSPVVVFVLIVVSAVILARVVVESPEINMNQHHTSLLTLYVCNAPTPFSCSLPFTEEHFKNAGVSKSASSTLLGSVALVQVAFCIILKLYFFRSIGNVTAFDPAGNITLWLRKGPPPPPSTFNGKILENTKTFKFKLQTRIFFSNSSHYSTTEDTTHSFPGLQRILNQPLLHLQMLLPGHMQQTLCRCHNLLLSRLYTLNAGQCATFLIAFGRARRLPR